MARERSFFVVPSIDPGRAPGLILCGFLFEFEDGPRLPATAEIPERLKSRLVCVDGSPSAGSLRFGAGPYAMSVGESAEMRRKAASLAGVRRVNSAILATAHEQSGWLDEITRERAEDSSAEDEG
jgi:hypothetical protein